MTSDGGTQNKTTMLHVCIRDEGVGFFCTALVFAYSQSRSVCLLQSPHPARYMLQAVWNAMFACAMKPIPALFVWALRVFELGCWIPYFMIGCCKPFAAFAA